MKAKRLVFAKQYEDRNEAKRIKILFSDESIVQQFPQRKLTVRRPFQIRFNDCYTQATVKHPPSFMIWGTMSSNGIAGLFFLLIDTTMHNVRYRKILEDKLEIYVAIHECNMFMQNGALCHRSKLVSDFLKKKNIKTLDWPGSRPDLNPIENFWVILKNKVADEHPTSATDLEMAIKRIGTQKITAKY